MYSVAPALKSRNSWLVVPAKLPLALPCRRNWPVGVVVPCPEMTSAEGPVCAVPDEMVYVVPPTTMLPLVIESVYPSDSLDVTVRVTVPDAVPLLFVVPMALYEPLVLVTVIVCPTVRLAAEGMPKERPVGPPPG